MEHSNYEAKRRRLQLCRPLAPTGDNGTDGVAVAAGDGLGNHAAQAVPAVQAIQGCTSCFGLDGAASVCGSLLRTLSVFNQLAAQGCPQSAVLQQLASVTHPSRSGLVGPVMLSALISSTVEAAMKGMVSGRERSDALVSTAGQQEGSMHVTVR